MPFVTDGTLGVNLQAPTTDAEFELGQRIVANDGSEWLYIQIDAGGVTAAGYVVLVDEAFAGDMIDTTNSATGFGQFVGVADAVFAASEYGWVQNIGTVSTGIRVAASAAANVALNTTATAGQLDDDASSGAEVINGLTLTTANGGSAATAAGVLTGANVGATLA